MTKLLDRRVRLIAPGDVSVIPTWIACRTVAPFDAITNEIVTYLQAPGPIAIRLQQVTEARTHAHEHELSAHSGLLPYLDEVLASPWLAEKRVISDDIATIRETLVELASLIQN